MALVPSSRPRGGRGSESHAARPALWRVLGRGARKGSPSGLETCVPFRDVTITKGLREALCSVMEKRTKHHVPVLWLCHTAPLPAAQGTATCSVPRRRAGRAVPTPPPAPTTRSPHRAEAAPPQPPLLSGPHRTAAGRRLAAAGHLLLRADPLGAPQPLPSDQVSVRRVPAGPALRWARCVPGGGQVRRGPPVHRPCLAGAGRQQPSFRAWLPGALFAPFGGLRGPMQ